MMVSWFSAFQKKKLNGNLLALRLTCIIVGFTTVCANIIFVRAAFAVPSRSLVVKHWSWIVVNTWSRMVITIKSWTVVTIRSRISSIARAYTVTGLVRPTETWKWNMVILWQLKTIKSLSIVTFEMKGNLVLLRLTLYINVYLINF